MNPVDETLIKNIIVRLKEKENNTRYLLKSKQEQIVFADGPNESTGISATRFALDDDIIMAENELRRVVAIIREVESIQKTRKSGVKTVCVGSIVTVEINDKQLTFLITNESEDTQNQILPITAPMGKSLLGHQTGDILENKMKIVSIM